MTAEEKPEAGAAGTAEPARFDEALKELEALVESLEQGDLPLDESLARFERGVRLARECRDALNTAEQRVQVLVENEDGSETLAPFGQDDDGDPGPDER